MEAQLQVLADRVVPILGFVMCITVLAELADRIGVFAVLADRIAVLVGGSVRRLKLLIVALATTATVVLSLDTTAVLLTPVVLAMASDQLRSRPRPCLMTPRALAAHSQLTAAGTDQRANAAIVLAARTRTEARG
jgi:Na+/H+ antiporter NhaD/arsenite permease-like protein